MGRIGQHQSRSWWRRLLWPGRSTSSWQWKIAAPVAFVCAGLLAATSAINARGTDLRGGRNDSLIEIVSSERAQVEALEQQSRSLQVQVSALSSAENGADGGLTHRAAAAGADAGLVGLTGSGVDVALSDAPHDETVPAGTDPDLLLVHQQDIQAVVNAFWAGGARGVSLQGKRVIATTGIKCVGNTVVLQGVPYSPPYRIVAVGDPTRLYRALMASPDVQDYLDYVPAPYHLGWSVQESAHLSVPGYAGPVDLQYAEPVQP
jgi:uncharacterized protein YlxW (UPF0749 family)